MPTFRYIAVPEQAAQAPPTPTMPSPAPHSVMPHQPSVVEPQQHQVSLVRVAGEQTRATVSKSGAQAQMQPFGLDYVVILGGPTLPAVPTTGSVSKTPTTYVTETSHTTAVMSKEKKPLEEQHSSIPLLPGQMRAMSL